MQSTGKKYKDCLATLRNWARKDNYKFPTESKKEEPKEDQIWYDINGLTEDEYRLVIRHEMTKDEMIKILEDRGCVTRY